MGWVKVEFFMAPAPGRTLDFEGVDLTALAERLATAVAPDEPFLFFDAVRVTAAEEPAGTLHGLHVAEGTGPWWKRRLRERGCTCPPAAHCQEVER